MKVFRMLLVAALVALVALPVQARTLRIVTLQIPPLVVGDRHGRVYGPAVDVVREVLHRAGFEADIEIVPWKRAFEMIRQGRADGLFAASKNAERTQFLLYPDEPLTSARVVVVADPGRGYCMDAEGAGTHGLVVGMLSGGAHGAKLEAFLDRARFADVRQVPLQRQGALMAAHGHLDAFIIVDTILPYFQTLIDSDQHLEIVRSPSGEPFIIDTVDGYLALSRQTMDRQAAVAVGCAIRAVKADGTFERMMTPR